MSEAPIVGNQSEQLEESLVQFAVRIITLANRLDASYASRHIAGQIIRSGSSAAPNYSEARSAESKADFVHKIRIALKELNETSIWLRIIAGAKLLKPELLTDLSAECAEFRRILGASLRTARARSVRQ